jgi:hypothetical protein
MKILSLKQVGEILGYNDLRSVRKWCKSNSLFIIKQGKSEVVPEAGFREAFDKPLITDLQKRFGSEWQTIYHSFLNGEIPNVTELKVIHSREKQSYKPKHEIISKYLSKYEKSNVA